MSIDPQSVQTGKFRRYVMPGIIAAVTMVVVAAVIYYALSAFFLKDAEDKIKNVLLSHRGLHHYIQKIMHPTYYKARDNREVDQNFYSPEILSSSFIVRNMHAFYNEEMKKAGLPGVYYKMASVNPRNPVNMADEFEASLIRYFNENREVREFRKVINVDGKKYLYYAIPFLETGTNCLKCHGKRQEAPPGLQALYPGEGGFNEKTGVYRAIESIRMPINDEVSTVLILTGSLSVGFAVMFMLFFFNKRLKVLVGNKTASLEAEIVERKQAEAALRESEEAYRTVADFTYDWEYWQSPDGTLRYVSPSCERHTGYSAEEFRQDPGLTAKITHPDDQESLNNHISGHHDASHKTHKHHLDFRITTRNGEERWFAHVCQPVYDYTGRYLGQRASNRDINERKQAEEEIHRLNAELEQRVQDRTAQLESANKELEAFCYSVSHDLRAPLRHIDGYVDLLISRYRTGLDDKGLHYVDTIAASARQMGTLIDDLLQFSRTGRTEMHQEHIDMNKVFQEALALVQGDRSDDTIEWVIEDMPSVRGDYALLRQVWANLLGNAVKYTKLSENARIEVKTHEENGEVIFVVEDNGVGFDMQYVGKLFGVFQRLHSQDQFEGTGIGLATVQRIINRHGGRVWAEGELNRGARFYFTLPI
jgi:PAS domain S-box-containing protein